MAEDLKEVALACHRFPTPGKISVTPTKDLANQGDLALAYSPGVAAASELIAENPEEVVNMTARGNLVGVITNGTAVLGLGAIGPLAAKPVMEGKGVLFKKFAGIDVFDIEIDETAPDKMVEIIGSFEPTFGGINLEDIKAPECFIIEQKLRGRMGFRCFMMTSTAPRFAWGLPSTTACALLTRTSRTSAWFVRAPARRRWPALECWPVLA